MSETSYTALQGKVCVVTLRGTAGTNYRWCLTSMPKELALFGMDLESDRSGLVGGIYQENFYFLVKGSEETDVELHFEMACISNPTEVAKTCTVEIRIIPADSGDFASLDTVAQVGNVDADALLKYGYVCDIQDNQNMAKPYGYPLTQDNQQMLKYGYPCGVQDSRQMLKYGYPCGVQDSQQMLKYGYPCGVQDSQQMLKYGYPCGIQDDPNMVKAYGYPCGVQDGQNLLKYGYPCGVQDK